MAFKGKREDAWRANLWLRTGRRVLWPLGSFPAPDAESLYAGTRALPWGDLLSPEKTFAVSASVRDSAFNHSGFVALKVKDAIADVMREKTGRRPDVDRVDPDVAVVAHVASGVCHVSLDTSGSPLHKRGYRVKSVTAPLNETLAAGILLLMAYDGSVSFADPFCGSGTLCIEAGLIATRTAPGLLRKGRFGFERWPGFKPEAWRKMVQEARESRRPARVAVMGSDRDRGAIVAAMANAEAAGLEADVRFERRSVESFQPPDVRGLIATNPPYGEHVGTDQDLPALYGDLGDVLKRRCSGWRAAVLAGNPALGKCIALHPKRKIPLFNGPMECRLFVYELYEGSRKG